MSASLNRREFSFGAIAGSSLSMASGCTQAGSTGLATGNAPGLKKLAADKGMYYGCAVRPEQLSNDSSFRESIITECSMVVPENAMKWGTLQPTPGPLRLSGADAIVNFAQSNGIRVRGHTAAWYRSVPNWALSAIKEDPRKISLLYDHVQALVSHYTGRVSEWDIVNEAIEPTEHLPGNMRNSIFYRAAGPDYIAECYKIAYQCDPSTRLVYNEYGLEYDTAQENLRRDSTIKLLSDLRSRNVPIHALGIQSHLKTGNRFNEEKYSRFLARVADLGLKIILTEFDVNDERLSADFGQRDREVASHAKTILDVAFDQRALVGVMTWGLTDRYNWLNGQWPRKDGLPHRTLPLDPDFERKPLWHVFADSFKKTVPRPHL